MKPSSLFPVFLLGMSVLIFGSATSAKAQRPDDYRPDGLRCEYLTAPDGVESASPRLSWRIRSNRRGAAQTAWQIRVASSPEQLAAGTADLWDSGRIDGPVTTQIAYGGRPLGSHQQCFWQVRSWDENGLASEWSDRARWSMGLAKQDDWRAAWISFHDDTPLPTDRKPLYLPPTRYYRKEFKANKPIKRAVVHASALGLYDLYCNGVLVDGAYLQPGWSDYQKRAYYRTHDITALLQGGRMNALGAEVADGWYSGYIAFARGSGYGANKLGRNFYGKTPAFRAQLEIDYADGTHETVVTDESWHVTDRGPTREADIIMGESYDARRELPGWSTPGYNAMDWESAVLAEKNPGVTVLFGDGTGDLDKNLGFVPPQMQAYPAQPVRATQELPARGISEPKPGVFVFDLGQNFAGNVRLKIKGASGTQIRLRYGEMLQPDGALMTANLRSARATDYYTLRGDPQGETWSPRFTYHGFQYVELTGLAEKPALGAITGLVLHNDMPATGDFECSDPVLTQFGKNAQWTQRANFMDIPTDCPQRDERLGWAADAHIYLRTASFNADVAAFFTKWMDDLVEAQGRFGGYPDYAPYPMTGNRSVAKLASTGWTDAGVICSWKLWKIYGDLRLVARCWDSLSRFMEWRFAGTTTDGLGTSIGNIYGDWLNVNEPTPIDFIDTCYYASDCTMMAEMADALNHPREATIYRARRARTQRGFAKTYLKPDGTLTVDTQTAYVLALSSGLIPDEQVAATASALARKIEAHGAKMTTGFLGTYALLPVLSSTGHHDLAVRLFQSRAYPSWGYEVVNGANSVWERWDSYTKESGFHGGMNSFSHYAFGSVMEWAYRVLVGIDADTPDYTHLVLAPRPPTPGSNPDLTPINWVKAHYDSTHGRIASAWKMESGVFSFDVTIPANITASILLPGATVANTTESGESLSAAKIPGIHSVEAHGDSLKVEVASGTYRFVVTGVTRKP